MKSISIRTKILLILTLLIQFLIIIYIKYDNQFLSVADFNILLTGNLITIVFYFILITEIILLFRKNKIKIAKSWILLVLSFIFLVAGNYSNHFPMPFNKYYFFGQFGNKLFTGLCFTLYFLTIVYFAFYILYSRIKPKLFSVKSFLSSIALMILFLIFSYIFILINESKLNMKTLDSKANNIIIVLGAAVWSDNRPSPILAARISKAAELTKTDLVHKIYFTGSHAPGEKSESEVAYNYFREINPNFTNFELESSTTSTNEQIQFIKNKILPIYRDHEIIVISDSFHLVRIREISNFHGIKIKSIASDFSMDIKLNLYNRMRESLALVVFWLFSI